MEVIQGLMPLSVYPPSVNTAINPRDTGASSPVGAELLARKVQAQTSFKGSPIGHMERLDHMAPSYTRDSSPLGAALMARKVQRQSDDFSHIVARSHEEKPLRPPSLRSAKAT